MVTVYRRDLKSNHLKSILFDNKISNLPVIIARKGFIILKHLLIKRCKLNA